MKSIKQIAYSNTVEGPAKANILTGVVTLNPEKFLKLSDTEQRFVLLHEAGHIANKSRDEQAADLWALRHATRYGLTPKQAVLAICDTLNPTNAAHVERANNLFYHYTKMKKLNNKAVANYTGDDYDAQFIGKAFKKWSDNRAAKREDKQAFKLEKIAARGANRLAVAEAGGSFGSAIGGVLGNVLGGLGAAGGRYENDGGDTPPPKDNTIIYIGLAVAAVVLFVVGKKKGWF